MRFAAKSGLEPLIGKRVEFELDGGKKTSGVMLAPIGRGASMRLVLRHANDLVALYRDANIGTIYALEGIAEDQGAGTTSASGAKGKTRAAGAGTTTAQAGEDADAEEERDRAERARKMRVARAKVLAFILKNGPTSVTNMRDKVGVNFSFMKIVVDNAIAYEFLRRDGKLVSIVDVARARAEVGAASSGTIEAAAPIAVFAPAGGGGAFVPVAPAAPAFLPAPVDPAIVFGADPRCPACGGKAEVRAGVLRCAKCGALDDAPRGAEVEAADDDSDDRDEDADGGGDDDDRDGDEPDDLVDPGGVVAQAGTGAAPGGVKVGAPVPAAPIAAKPPEKNLPWALPAIPVPRNGRIVDVVA